MASKFSSYLGRIIKEETRKVLREKIILPPRHLGVYLDLINKKILKVYKGLRWISDRTEKIASQERDSWDFWGNLINFDGIRYIPQFSRLYGEDEDWSRIIERIKETYGFVRSVESTEDKYKMLGYIVLEYEELLKAIQESFEKKEKIFSLSNEELTQEFNKAFEEYLDEYTENYLKTNEIDHLSREDEKKILQAIFDLKELVAFLPEAISRIEQIKTQAYGTYHQHDWRPESGEEEILYHASVNAAIIAERGFSKEWEERGGLGGTSSTRGKKKGVSFTSDLYVAKEVMRCLKEAVMIAKGQIKVRHILDWMKRENEKKYEDLKKYGEVNKYMQDEPEKVMYMYRYYLLASKRYDPLFFGDMRKLMEEMKSVDEKNIGVIKAKINMTDKDIYYLTSMQEYRVPVNSIISIEGIIK